MGPSDETEFQLRSLRIADASETKLDIESGVQGVIPQDCTRSKATAARDNQSR